MPNDVFEISRDLSIRYYNPTTAGWTQIIADSVEVEIDQGIDIEDSVYAKGSIGTCTVKLVKKNLSDFLSTPGYQAGYPIEIAYRPFPDSNPGIWNLLFYGTIQNIAMGYANESQSLMIEITANDSMRKFQNTIVSPFSVTGTVAQRSYRNCMINLFNAVGVSFNPGGSGASATTQRSFTWLNTPAGEIASQFLDAELGWVYPLKNGSLSYLTRTDVATKQAIPYVNGNPTISNVHYSNLLTNGNFETNTSGWTSPSSTVLSRDTSTFYNGLASMNVSTNYVTNSFFDSNIAGWSGYGSTIVFRGTVFYSSAGGTYPPYEGTGFLNTATPGLPPGSLYIAQNNAFSLPITAGVNYTVSARNRTYWPTQVAIGINWYGAGGFISQTNSGPITSSNLVWKEVTHSAVAPAGTIKAEVVCFTVTSGSGYEESGWDNFMLEETSGRNFSYGTQTNTVMNFSGLDKVKGSVRIKNLTNTSSVRLDLVYLNSGGSPISTTTGNQIAINRTDWTEITATGIAPIGTDRVQMNVTGIKTAAGPGVMYLDNAKLENLTRISGAHYCLDEISLKYDSDDLVNKAVVIDKTTLTRTVASNTASITAYGEQSGEFTVDFDSAAGPTTFANLASEIVNASTIKQVQQVSVPVIRDDGRAGDIADREIGSTIQVEFAQDPLPPLQVVSIISRINHVITPQIWMMNIGLWRGM